MKACEEDFKLYQQCRQGMVSKAIEGALHLQGWASTADAHWRSVCAVRCRVLRSQLDGRSRMRGNKALR